jgi:hypothetical protein
MKTKFNKGDVIGHLTIGEGVKETEHYEFAAWYRDHALTPGVYPVVIVDVGYESYFDEAKIPRDDPRRYSYTAIAVIPSVITGANLGTYFGGVPVGKDTAGEREIGRASEFRMASSWKVIHGGKYGEPFGFLNIPGVSFELADEVTA